MPELPPPIPPQFEPPKPKEASSLAGVDYKVTLLDEPTTNNNGCLTVLASLLILLLVGGGTVQIFSHSMEAAIGSMLFGTLILMFVAIYASLPIWVGLGMSPTIVRISVVVLLCGPFLLARFEGFLTGVVVQVFFSVPFWMMRLFRWRIQSANQLTIIADERSEVHFIPVRQSSQEIESYIRRHMQSTKPDGPLDSFKPAQFSILQMIAFTTVFGVVVAFLKLAQDHLSIFDIRGMALTVLVMMYAIIVAMQILAIWTMLATENVLRRYLASITVVALLWIAFFVVMALVDERGTFEFFFEGLLWMLLPTTVAFILLCGILSMFRNMGYRLIRLPPTNIVERDSQM
jgi:hypothetical protein